MTESSEKQCSWEQCLETMALLIFSNAILTILIPPSVLICISLAQGYGVGTAFGGTVFILFLAMFMPIVVCASLFMIVFPPVVTALTMALFHLHRVWQAVLISGFWAAAGWFATRITYWAWDGRWYKITDYDLAKVAEELMYIELIALPMMALSAYIVLVRIPRQNHSGKRYRIKQSRQ